MCKSALKLLLGAGFVSLAGIPAFGADGWSTSWSSASASARTCGQPLVVLVEHEGCPDCEIMSRSLAARASKDALSCAAKVRLEFTHHPALMARYNVSLTPTFLVLSPEKEGLTEVYREVGSMSVGRIVEVGKSIRQLADRLSPQVEQKPKEKLDEKVELAQAAPTPAEKKKPVTAKKSSNRKSKKTRKQSQRASQPAQQPAQQQSYQTQDQYGRQIYYQERPRFWPRW